MWTFRSRGMDISAVARFDGSSRTSIIVSDLAPARKSAAPGARWSAPIRRTVWGLPLSACARSLGRLIVLPCLNALTTLSISWNAATPVAEADASMTSTAPTRYRFQRPRRSSSNAQVALSHGLGQRGHELDQGLAVVGERLDRNPLLGPVMAAAHRPELHRRHAGVQEADRVGCAVAAHRDPARRPPARDRGR